MSVTKKQRTLSFAVVILTLIQYIFLSVPVRAASGADNTSESIGGTVSAHLYSSGNIIGKAENWEGTDGSTAMMISNTLGKFKKVSSSSASLCAEISFKNTLNVTGTREIGVYIKPITESPYTITFTADHNKGTSSISEKVNTSDKMYIFMQLPEDITHLSHISVAVNFDRIDTGSDSVINLYDVISSDVDHAENINRFSVFSLDGINNDNTVVNGTPVIGTPVITDDPDESFIFSVNAESTSGSMTFYMAQDGENFIQYGSAMLSSHKRHYVFEAPSAIGNNTSYKIEYSGNDTMKLLGISAVPFNGAKADHALGSISKCSYSSENETLTVNGTITRDAATAYPQGELRLYEIPMWQNTGSIVSDTPVLTVGMTTTFSMQHTVSAEHSMFCSYVVAIHYEGKLYPLTDPMFPGRGLAPTSTTGKLTVSGISCEDSFTAGFDRYIIDINVSDLFLSKNERHDTVFSYDGTTYYPNKNFVNDISKKVDFLSASGIDVIFRITDSDSNEFYPELETGCRDFAALISFLSVNFSPDGIIIGTAEIKSKTLPKNYLVSVKAKNTASLVRLASSVAGKDTVIYSTVDTNDSELFTWLLAKYMEDMPMTNWEILIPDNADCGIDIIENAAVSGGYSFGISVFLTSDSKSAMGTLSAAGTGSRRSLFIHISDGRLPVNTSTENKVLPVTNEWDDKNGAFLIWDFTSSYDNGGFTVLSGKTGLYTRMSPSLAEHTGISRCRALKTVLSDKSRLILAKPSASMNLADCPKVRFLLECTSDTPFSLDFIFISGKNRVTFTADFDGTGIYAPVCDLSGMDIADKVDRIAIVLKNDTTAEIGIATVSAAGDKNISEIKDSIYIKDFTDTVEQITNPGDTSKNVSLLNMEYIAIGSVAIISVLVFVLLSIKKRDEQSKT